MGCKKDSTNEKQADPLPVITTANSFILSPDSARSGGTVSSSGTSFVTARGVVWDTMPMPTLPLVTRTVDGVDTGTFVSSIPNLAEAKAYFVRAYATNAAGTSYGEQKSFLTPGIVQPVVVTIDATAVFGDTALAGGYVASNGSSVVTARGVVWDTLPLPKITLSTKTINGNDTGIFSARVSNIVLDKTYYLRAFATSRFGTSYGAQDTFVSPKVLPTFSASSTIANVSLFSATFSASVSTGGTSPVTAKGFVWDTLSSPTISLTSKTNEGSGTGNFTSTVNNLAPATTYYLRAYATSSAGTSYSTQDTFRTQAIELPTLTTTTLSGITSVSASGGGNVVTAGSTPVLVRGVVWDTFPNPDVILNTKTTDGAGLGLFTSSLTALVPAKTYYARAYATNSFGTAYGSQETFTTLAGTPLLQTLAVSNISFATATSGGNITSSGAAAVSIRGVVWDTLPNPTIALTSRTVNGIGQGSYMSDITGLEPSKNYYVRAYATNNYGTSYGQQVTFTTQNIVLPSLTTMPVHSVTFNSGISGGDISSAGSTPVLVRGVVWDTLPNPTIALVTRSFNGAGNGPFTSSINGLVPNKLYYVRAYATTTYGTSYGGPQTFTTLIAIPTLSTAPVTSVTPYTAKSGGDITNSGGAPILVRGVVWDTLPNPVVFLQTKTTDGAASGPYTSDLFGLSSNKIYYMRAYATNSYGTAYGNQLIFTTPPDPLPFVETINATGISGDTAIAGGNILSSGTSAVIARGVVWDDISANPTINLATKTVDGSGTGAFQTSIKPLSPGKTYYMRAYATNSSGTAYGHTNTFMTSSNDGYTLYLYTNKNTDTIHGGATHVGSDLGWTHSFTVRTDSLKLPPGVYTYVKLDSVQGRINVNGTDYTTNSIIPMPPNSTISIWAIGYYTSMNIWVRSLAKVYIGIKGLSTSSDPLYYYKFDITDYVFTNTTRSYRMKSRVSAQWPYLP